MDRDAIVENVESVVVLLTDEKPRAAMAHAVDAYGGGKAGGRIVAARERFVAHCEDKV